MSKSLVPWIAALTTLCAVSPALADVAPSETTEWAAAVFAERAPTPPGESLCLVKQDHGSLNVNRSVLDTPLRIGQQSFSRGLGTHANSEIVVNFPAGEFQRLEAAVGIDNNHDTQGRLGSAEFSVEVDGKETFRSRTLHGGEEPLPVRVELPEGARRIVLKTHATADGAAHDHADWAEARLLRRDGTVLWLDELASRGRTLWPTNKPPLSFVYGRKSSESLLAAWPRESKCQELADRTLIETSWTDPQTGLKLIATAAAFKDFPAVDWVVRFENTGAKDTPILEKVQALDATLAMSQDQSLVLDQICGDDCSERSFVPIERKLNAGELLNFAPVGGRPSNGEFPFFNLQSGAGGFFAAIGWTGQWAVAIRRDAAGPTRLQAGMELTHLVLHPGEAIRTPRIMLLRWSGDRIDAHNTFRRLLLAHYLPKLNGKPVDLAITAQSFNRYAGGARPIWGTEAGQVAAAKIAHELGCDTHWFDAGWFEGDFPNGVGNWFPKPKQFPRGLKPIGDACASMGMKFLVWYEPERVADGTQIAREHPEFVLPKQKPTSSGGLFDLGNPQARRWLADLLLRQIAEFNIHTYRNDFNIDPLPFWRQNDPPDRQGITEIRYVEGLYQMWDELRAKYPQIYLDDCASGGRRIDLEMVMRSVVQTRSDTACTPGRSEWDHSQTYGLSLYLPLHATIGWDVGAYECRSSGAAGFCAEWDLLDASFPKELARRCVAEIRENRKYWSGDYYPLTPWSMADEAWMAWQLHRPDLNEGMVLAFRHKNSPYSAIQAPLRGLDADAKYRVQFIDDQHRTAERMMTGRELSSLELRLPHRRSSVLVRYAVMDR